MLITFFLLLIIMTVICGAVLVYQGGDTALIWASYNGRKDFAIALAERGADLNIKNRVSDCYLCVYDDDDNDAAGVSATLIAAICIYGYVYVYVYVCVCIYVFICMYAYVCECIYVYMYVCTCMYICMYVCVYVHGRVTS